MARRRAELRMVDLEQDEFQVYFSDRGSRVLSPLLRIHLDKPGALRVAATMGDILPDVVWSVSPVYGNGIVFRSRR